MLEQVLERVANALDAIKDLLGEDLAVHREMAGLYRELVRSKGGNVDAVDEEARPETPVAREEAAAVDDRKAREEEYEALKAKLIERGVEIPPRTKLTTLQKLWEQHKDAPVKAEVVEPELPEMPDAPAEPEVVEADPFASPAEEAAPAETRDYAKMSADEARALIMANYDSGDSDKALLVAALASIKAPNWLAVPAGKHGEVAKAYLASKGVAL